MVLRMCEMCPLSSPSAAVVYCDADACYLCAACDEDVHQANRLAQRHVRRPVSEMDAVQSSGDTDVLVPDVVAQVVAPTEEVSSKGLSSEVDPAFADFDEFEGIAFGKMPTLAGSESDSQLMSLPPGDALKGFDAEELSWEAVVPEDFERVVPDIESVAALCKAADVRTEATNVSSMADPDAMVPAVPVVPTSTRTTGPALRPTVVKAKPAMETSALSAMSLPVVLSPHQFSAKSALLNFPSSPVSSSEVTQSPGDVVPFPVDTKSETEPEMKTAEERKQMRMEALARFRSKRANRSFQKKIRYGCRKVLAESRPRVKGRFVRKADMALYRRYGANYADFKGVPGALDGCDLDATEVQPSC